MDGYEANGEFTSISAYGSCVPHGIFLRVRQRGERSITIDQANQVRRSAVSIAVFFREQIDMKSQRVSPASLTRLPNDVD
jgi:hypothetical protein